MADISTALFVMSEAANLTPRPLLASGQMATVSDYHCGAVSSLPIAAAILLSAIVGTAVWLTMRPGGARVTRFAISPMGAAALVVDSQSRDLTITPDGTHIVYKGSGWTD